jgi:caffeoyl-CoA O-methyltransferase
MNVFEIPAFIQQYSEQNSTEEEAVLQELYRETYLKTVHPQMISGKVQGRLLALLSRLKSPASVLEIGTFTGYSAYCLHRGLKEGGRLVTIEVNEELEDLIRAFFRKAGIETSIRLEIGDAREVIPELTGNFDLVFIDANKEHYLEYLDLVKDRINPGGLLIADNVLWGGKVTRNVPEDHSTKILQEFNRRITGDPSFENVLLSVRDGLMLAIKS